MSDLKNKQKEEVFNEINQTDSNEDQNSDTANENAELSKEEPEVSLSEEEKLRYKVSEMNDKFIRLYAEFDNFKKRTATERLDLIKTAGKDIIVSMLPVLDDFDRAIQVMESANDIQSIKEGVLLVRHKFNKILEQRGLTPMESQGQDFNSDLAEAITGIPVSEEMKGKVVDVVEKGYLLNEKVIRFAKVIVGN